jgi:hypothetical protein
MTTTGEAFRSLSQIEAEVDTECREFKRLRLRQKLQTEADRHGGVFPPQWPTDAAPAPTGDAPADRRRRH